MVISLSPRQFKQFNKLIETSRRAMSEVEQGEVSLSQNGNTDSIEWSNEEVIVTIED